MDKVALVTGGSKGIGYACAERLLADGYAVAICARNAGEVEAAAGRLRRSRDRCLGCGPTSARPTTAPAWSPAVTAHFGRIDALVNNAGRIQPGAVP